MQDAADPDPIPIQQLAVWAPLFISGQSPLETST